MLRFSKVISFAPLYSALNAPAYAMDATTELLAQKGAISAEEYEKIRKAQSSQATVDMSDGLKISTGDKNFTAQIGTMLQLDAAGHNTDFGIVQDAMLPTQALNFAVFAYPSTALCLTAGITKPRLILPTVRN